MGNTVVGIKTAQGEFFPILDPSSGKKRRVILVPSRNEQENVKIQIFQQFESDPAEPIYLSSIFLENVTRKESGEREIELILSADNEMNIYASARDLGTGEVKSISVVTRKEGQDEYSVPAAEFDDLSGVVPVHDSVADAEIERKSKSDSFNAGEEFSSGQPGKPVHHGVRPLYLATFVVIGLVIILAVAWFILSGTQPAAPAMENPVQGLIPGIFQVASLSSPAVMSKER